MIADHESRSQHRDLVVAAEVELAELGWTFRRVTTLSPPRSGCSMVRGGMNHPCILHSGARWRADQRESGFDLVNALRSQTRDWVDISPCLPDKVAAAELLESAKAALLRQFREARRFSRRERRPHPYTARASHAICNAGLADSSAMQRVAEPIVRTISEWRKGRSATCARSMK